MAELLKVWLKCVIQAVRPWISAKDIDRGALWFTEISKQLGDTGVGIVCLTAENKNKPWILFEAGALAKGLPSNRVCTLLIDLKPAEVEGPLAQFNHTSATEEGIWLLLATINASLKDNALEEPILKAVFDTNWPQFKSKFEEILRKMPETTEQEKRTEESMLAEILENTRSLNARVRQLEIKAEGSAPESMAAGALTVVRSLDNGRYVALNYDDVMEKITRQDQTHRAKKNSPDK